MPAKVTLCLLLTCATTAASASAQSQTTLRESAQQTPAQPRKSSHAADPARLLKAISSLESGDFAPFDVEIIAESNAVQAIPLLETQFERSKDPIIKEKIANALVRLGKRNGPYWDFMVDRANQVLKDGPPTPFKYDASGKALAEPPQNFIEWAKRHRMSLQQALDDATIEAPAAIINLGSSDDERAVPILREALASENDFVKVEAANGLAALHDTASVPDIVEACANAPEQVAASLARSLVYFDDPAAQHAVDTYLPESTAQELREARANGKTPYN